MSALLFFLGIVTLNSNQNVEDSVEVLPLWMVTEYVGSMAGIISADPQVRTLSAWMLPCFVVKGDTLAVAGFSAGDFRISYDGIPLNDPQTGEHTLFMPVGSVSATGLTRSTDDIAPVVDLVPGFRIRPFSAYAGITSPFFLNSGFNRGSAEVSLSVPVTDKALISLDGAAMMWDQRPQTNIDSIPRRGMTAYSGMANVKFNPSEKMTVKGRALRSVQQQDEFSAPWVFNPLSAPYRARQVNLFGITYRYQTDILFLEMDLSGYSSFLWHGPRQPGDLKLFGSIDVQDTSSVVASKSNDNPFGVPELFYSPGINPVIDARGSDATRAYIKVNLDIDDNHQIRGHLKYAAFGLSREYTHETQDNLTWRASPNEGELFVADHITNIDRTWWIDPGFGVMLLDVDDEDSTGMVQSFTSFYPLPRVEGKLFFDRFTFGGGTDLAADMPPYSFFYDYTQNTPVEDSLVLFNHQRPRPMRAWRTWGSVNYRNKYLSTGLKVFANYNYRLPAVGVNPQDESNDISTAGVLSQGKGWCVGINPSLEFYSRWMNLHLSYRFAAAQATSSSILGEYERLLAGDTATEYSPIESDSRHKITVDGHFYTPSLAAFWADGWFISPRFTLASGFPSEISDDQSIWWSWLTLSGGRNIDIGKFHMTLSAVVINPFNWQKPVIGEIISPSASVEDFPDRVVLGDEDYHPSRDGNHDGFISAEEEVAAYQRARAYYDACCPSPLPARQIEFKLSFSFY